MISIILVEDDPIIAESLMHLINSTQEFHIVHHFLKAENFLSKPEVLVGSDIILMDISLPGMNGIEAVRGIKLIEPTVPIIMLTVHADESMVFDSLCAGASGYLLKHAGTLKIKDAIQEVLDGGAPMTAKIARMVVDQFSKTVDSPLSEREYDVLHALCEGKSYKLIADALHISMHTVRTHIRHIYKKLEVNSSVEAVAKAYRNRWV